MNLGEIYLYDYENADTHIVKKRPVVVVNINEKENEVQIVPITSRVNTTFRVAWRIITSIKLSGKNRDVCILCDKINTVLINKLGMKVGYLDENSFSYVAAGVAYYEVHPNEKIEKIPVNYKAINGEVTVVVTQQELLEQAIDGIKDLTSKFDKANSHKEKWKERGISFAIGVLSGIVATLIISG